MNISNVRYELNLKKWNNTLEELIKYIKLNNKAPTQKNKLGRWINTQNKNYKKNSKIMKDYNIRSSWEKFIKDYEKYLDFDKLTINTNIWYLNLSATENYIKKNNKLPTKYTKNSYEKKLANWINKQKHDYKYNKNIMINEENRLLWDNFHCYHNKIKIDSFNFDENDDNFDIDIDYDELNLLIENSD